MIDFRKLEQAQAPDYKNNRIPVDATDGAVNWVRIDNVPVMGRVVVIQRNGGTASNYDCCICPCPQVLVGSGAYISPLTGFMSVGGTAPFGFTAYFQNCNYHQFPYDETDYAAWSSSNTNVMTMDQTKKGEAHGLSPGSTGNQAQVSECAHYYQSGLGICTCSYNAQATGPGQGAVGASIQVSGIVASPTTVHVNNGTKSSTITVTVYHFGTNSISGANATVEISNYSSSPAGNDLDGLPYSYGKDIQAPDGNTAWTFLV